MRNLSFALLSAIVCLSARAEQYIITIGGTVPDSEYNVSSVAGTSSPALTGVIGSRFTYRLTVAGNLTDWVADARAGEYRANSWEGNGVVFEINGYVFVPQVNYTTTITLFNNTQTEAAFIRTEVTAESWTEHGLTFSNPFSDGFTGIDIVLANYPSNPDLFASDDLSELFATSVADFNSINFLFDTYEAGNGRPSLWLAPDTFSVTVVPEPSTYAAIAGALALGLVAVRRRRQ